MSRKQADYLAGLLGEDDEAGGTTPSPAVPATPASAARGGAMTLLARESALARVASGEVRQVTQLQLDPARVRIWPGNARIQAQLNEERVRDLIDSILAEGGQKVPVVVRRTTDDPDHEYELVVGTRRHFAIRWLRANNYPDVRLLAQVADIDDEAAFRLADIENRARQDVTDIERARNYAAALSRHYGNRQARMAERLRLSPGWLSKMLKAATIPDGVLAAFSNLGEVTLKPGYALAQALDDPARAKSIVATARAIAARQTAARQAGRPTIAGGEVFRQLMAAGPDSPARPALFSGRSELGRAALSVTAAGRQGLTVKVHAASGASEDELVTMFRDAIAHHLAHR